jgi:hypothetical protein
MANPEDVDSREQRRRQLLHVALVLFLIVLIALGVLLVVMKLT